VDPVADLELGLAEDLPVGLGGEQLGDALDLVLDDGHETLLDPVGLVALLGRQREGDPGHGAAFREESVKRSGRRIDVLRCTKFSTYNRDAHPECRSCRFWGLRPPEASCKMVRRPPVVRGHR
jgi:hypothetical protein